MRRVSQLANLQSIDLELDDKTRLLKQLEEKLASDAVIAEARGAMAGEEKHLAELRASLSLRELEAKSLDGKIKDINDRLYSGRVQNPKELDGIEKDLQNHRRQRSDLDDVLLELMDSVEQAQARVLSKRADLDLKQGARAADVAQMSHERDVLIARLHALDSERERARSNIDADSIRIYDHLRLTKAGRPVSPVKRDACSSCGVSVPTGLVQRIRAGEELVFCSGCGRILA